MVFRPASLEEIQALSTDDFDLESDLRKLTVIFLEQLARRPVSELQVRLGVEPQLLKTVHPDRVPRLADK